MLFILVLIFSDRLFGEIGDDSLFGDGDFATVSDLNTQEDKIELFGNARQYSLEFGSNGEAQLIYNSELDADSKLIAVLENVSADLSIDEPVFTFV